MVKSIKRKKLSFSSAVHPADKEMSTMRYTDLKIACIQMGMSFQAIVDGDHSTLSRFFKENFGNNRDKERVAEFDSWVAQKLIKKGYDPKDPLVTFRLSSMIEIPEETSGKPAVKKVIKKKLPKVEKKKREVRDGVIKGTKKDLTFQLTKKGLDVKKVIEKVMKEFPDAREKSIKIWYRKAQRLG